MKIFLTEVIKDDQPLIGPYIKAETMDKAMDIAEKGNGFGVTADLNISVYI